MDTITAIKTITSLGLSETSAIIYVDLTRNKTSSALEIANRTGIARTSVYRALEELENAELVRFDGRNRTRYRAESYKKLRNILELEEQKIRDKSNTLPELFSYLLALSGDSAGTEVNHYEGANGLKKIVENTLNARGTFRALESSSMNTFLDFEYAEYIRAASIKNEIVSRQISNQKKSDDFTNVAGYVNKFWFLRYIDAKLLPIEVDIWIYNDTVVVYDYKDELFAVEITNEKLARMQRMQYDFIWKQAKPMSFIGAHGAAELR